MQYEIKLTAVVDFGAAMQLDDPAKRLRELADDLVEILEHERGDVAAELANGDVPVSGRRWDCRLEFRATPGDQ